MERKTNRILGCTVLGLEGGEVMTMVQIAMMGKLPYTALKEAIFAHPTLAEGLNNVFLALEQLRPSVVPAPDRSPRQSSGGNNVD